MACRESRTPNSPRSKPANDAPALGEVVHTALERLPAGRFETAGEMHRALASILRVAESLDRSHGQVITGLELRQGEADLLMQLRANTDAELEVWAANRHLQPFERLVGKPVRLVCES